MPEEIETEEVDVTQLIERIERVEQENSALKAQLAQCETDVKSAIQLARDANESVLALVGKLEGEE